MYFAIIESPLELIVVLIVAILLFGHKLPAAARSMGLSISEFRKGMREADIHESRLDEQTPPTDTQIAITSRDAPNHSTTVPKAPSAGSK